MYASEIRAQLDRLHLERLEAEATGLTSCAAYMADDRDCNPVPRFWTERIEITD